MVVVVVQNILVNRRMVEQVEVVQVQLRMEVMENHIQKEEKLVE